MNDAAELMERVRQLRRDHVEFLAALAKARADLGWRQVVINGRLCWRKISAEEINEPV